MNGLKYSPSIAVDDVFMDEIFRYLSAGKQNFKEIVIHYPINKKSDIDVFI